MSDRPAVAGADQGGEQGTGAEQGAGAEQGVDRLGGTHFRLVVLAALLWGTGGVAGALLGQVAQFPAVVVAAARLTVAGAVLLAVLALTGRLPRLRERATLGRVVVVGVLAAVYQVAYFAAVERVSVSVATFVALGAAPVLVATATAVATRRRPSAAVTAALVLALVGLALLTAGPAPVPGPGLAGAAAAGDPGTGAAGAQGVAEGAMAARTAGTWAGLALALLAAAAFATMTVLNRRPVPGLSPVAMTGVSFTVGGALLLPWALGVAPAASAVPGRGWVLVAFLGVVPTAAAYAAYFTGLRRVPATRAALVSLLEPATAAVAAALLLGDRLGPVGVLGGALLVVATVVVRPRREQDGVPAHGPASPTMDAGLR